MANLWIDPPGKPVTGSIRFLSSEAEPTLYMARTEPAKLGGSPLPVFQTLLAPVTGTSDSIGSGKTLPTLTLEQPFGSVPDWDLSSDRDGTLHLAHQIFGGGWNLLRVASVQNGTLQEDSVYGIGDCGFPRLVRDTSGKGASRVLVTCVLDRENLVLMLPGTPVSGGTVPIEPLELGPAGPGLAFADLSGDMPTRLDLLLKTEIRQGPLCSSGLFRGTLTLAGFDLSSKTPSTPTPLVPGTEDRRGLPYGQAIRQLQPSGRAMEHRESGLLAH
jgi:hypothetical protein